MISHAKMDEFYADGFHNNRHLFKKNIHTNCTMCLKRFIWWSGRRGGLTAGSRAGAV